MQEELEEIVEWGKYWNLKFAIRKTKSIIFRNRNKIIDKNFRFRLVDEEIEEVKIRPNIRHRIIFQKQYKQNIWKLFIQIRKIKTII